MYVLRLACGNRGMLTDRLAQPSRLRSETPPTSSISALRSGTPPKNTSCRRKMGTCSACTGSRGKRGRRMSG